jgi:drug/metabolite transporter (DMT)-like permease
MAMTRLSSRQLILLVLLTVVWGLNWPVMKAGIADFPPLSFRALSLWLGLPVLGLGMWWLKVPLMLPRGPGGAHWRELIQLATTNMFVWHACMIIALGMLSSGRAAILGYTMPIFSALIGAWLFGNVVQRRGWLGVGAAALGVLLLLWHEVTTLSGNPLGVGLALVAAATWALGTQQLRHTALPVATLTLSFWMTALTAVVVSVLALLLESADLRQMPVATRWAVVYNAVLIFGFAHATWFYLARSLPPVASTLSVMLIPVLGVFSGAWWLNEVLHWQDWAAVALMVVSIASVLWPSRSPPRS